MKERGNRIEDLAPLCEIKDAARALGIPPASLRSAAENHGYIVRMGRAIRLERDRLTDLVKKCRDKPKELASINSPIARAGISATRVCPTAARAANAVKMLKKPSRPTSQPKGETVLQMSRGM